MLADTQQGESDIKRQSQKDSLEVLEDEYLYYEKEVSLFYIM